MVTLASPLMAMTGMVSLFVPVSISSDGTLLLLSRLALFVVTRKS